MSFATSSRLAAPPGEGVVVAERALMSSDCSAMSSSLYLLDVHEKRLELRRLRVGVAHERRQGVGDVAVLGQPHEAPVDRDADGMHLLARHGERLQALGDDRHGDDESAHWISPARDRRP